jgi:hypothetical protein
MEPRNLFETIQAFKKEENTPAGPNQIEAVKYSFETEIKELFKKGRGYDHIIGTIESLQLLKEIEQEILNNTNIDQSLRGEVEQRLETISHNLAIYIDIDSLIFQYSFCLERYFLRSETRYYFLRYFSEDENSSVFQKFFKKVMFPFLLSADLTFESFTTEVDLLLHINYPNYQIEDFNLKSVCGALLPFFKTNEQDSIGNPISEIRYWAIIENLKEYQYFLEELDYRLLLLLEFFSKIAKDDIAPEIEKYIKQYHKNWNFVE